MYGRYTQELGVYAKEEAARLREDSRQRRSISDRSPSLKLLEYEKGRCVKCRSEWVQSVPQQIHDTRSQHTLSAHFTVSFYNPSVRPVTIATDTLNRILGVEEFRCDYWSDTSRWLMQSQLQICFYNHVLQPFRVPFVSIITLGFRMFVICAFLSWEIQAAAWFVQMRGESFSKF